MPGDTTILRLPEVRKVTGLSRSTIYSLIEQNSFPSQISIGSRAVGWISGEIDAWISGQIARSRPTGKGADSNKFQKMENQTSEGAQQ